MHYLVTADGLGKGIVVIHTYLRARKKDNDVMDMKLSNYKRNLNLLVHSNLDFTLSCQFIICSSFVYLRFPDLF